MADRPIERRSAQDPMARLREARVRRVQLEDWGLALANATERLIVGAYRAGYNQNEIAEASGYSQSYVSKLLTLRFRGNIFLDRRGARSDTQTG